MLAEADAEVLCGCAVYSMTLHRSRSAACSRDQQVGGAWARNKRQGGGGRGQRVRSYLVLEHPYTLHVLSPALPQLAGRPGHESCQRGSVICLPPPTAGRQDSVIT